MTEQNRNDQRSTRLVVIARDASGQIVTRISSCYKLAGAMRTARSVLCLKPEAVRAELHYQEDPMSIYSGKPLVTISIDDVFLVHR